MRYLLTLLLLAAGLVLSGPSGLVLGVPGSPVQAQESAQDAAPDYARWESVASRAEAALEDGRASTAAFEVLRATLAEWRATFLSAQDLNTSRIGSINSQIAALGPAPAEGATEPQEIADRRAELTSQLATLQAPRLRAVEAFERADALIGEIDTLVRSRDTERLLELGPSPLNPANWQVAMGQAEATLTSLAEEMRVALSSPGQRKVLSNNAPAIILLLIVTALLVLRAPAWLHRFSNLFGLSQRPGVAMLAQRLSGLGTVLFTILAGFTFAAALRQTGLLGFRGQAVVDVIPLAVVAVSFGRWVAPFLLVRRGTPKSEAALSRLFGWLGFVWAGNQVVLRLGQADAWSDTTYAVSHLPFILGAGLILFRSVQIMRRNRQGVKLETGQEKPLRYSIQRMFNALLGLISVIAPLAALAGYTEAAVSFIFPAILTLGLMGAVIALGSAIRGIYALLTGKDEDAVQASLVPILGDLMLILVALPIGALLWGMRSSQLLELWSRFQAGVQVGDTRLSPGDFLTFALVFVIGYTITRALQSALRNSVLPKTRMDIGGQNAVISGVGYVGIFLAALVAISSAGLDLSSLAIVAGALSVGIGFGLQNIVSNFVSGIILLIERPISEGDWIEVGGQMGYVRDISVRSTRIETFDRSDVIVPNADLVSGTVTNYTRGNLIGRVIVPVSVAYGTDTRKVEKILMEIAEAHPLVLLNPPPSVVFQNFGADGLDFEIRAILRDVNFVMATKSDMNHEIARRFTEEGIEIPFPQRDLWLRNPEVLAASGKESR